MSTLLRGHRQISASAGGGSCGGPGGHRGGYGDRYWGSWRGGLDGQQQSFGLADVETCCPSREGELETDLWKAWHEIIQERRLPAPPAGPWFASPSMLGDALCTHNLLIRGGAVHEAPRLTLSWLAQAEMEAPRRIGCARSCKTSPLAGRTSNR